MTRKTAVEPEALAEQLAQVPAATDRLRLAGLDHAARLQTGRLGATERRLALMRARRPDDTVGVARIEAALQAEQRVTRAYQAGVQRAEIEAPKRDQALFVLHGRVFDQQGAPAEQLTVSAIDAEGGVRRFTCTDAGGYFRMDLPANDASLKALFLQVSDADQAVLYRGDEALSPAPGGIVYREIRLSGARLEPCPIPPDRATMPHLLDRPEAEAIAILGRLGLKMGQRLTQRAPDRVGLVISQEPAAGTPITPTTSVTLVIGTVEQGDTVAVPNIVGQTVPEADGLLQDVGLSLGRRSEKTGAPVGTVLDQSPAAGTRVSPGTAVNVVVAVAPPDERVVVPEVIGTFLQEAEVILKDTGLQVGRVSFRDDDRVDRVLEQTPKAGERVAKETAVDLVVGRARAVEQVKVPDVLGQTLRGAAEILEATRLKVGQVTGSQDGRVREQKPQAGTEVQVGTPVDLRLSVSPGFADRLARNIAADNGFVALEIDPDQLRERLVATGVTTPAAAQRVVEMDNQQLQQTFGLRNLAHARSFRRIVRTALAQTESED
ncbi:MAG TPA: PASTA domain-containing protein [Geminicoccaceae bacterium]